MIQWIPELRASAPPQAPIILVATKLDLRGGLPEGKYVSTIEGT